MWQGLLWDGLGAARQRDGGRVSEGIRGVERGRTQDQLPVMDELFKMNTFES